MPADRESRGKAREWLIAAAFVAWAGLVVAFYFAQMTAEMRALLRRLF